MIKNKKLLYLTITILLMVIGAGAVLAARTYICRFGGQCSSTEYGVTLHHPATWKVTRSNDGLQIVDPGKQAPVGLIPLGKAILGDSDANQMMQLVQVQPHPHIAGVWDVQAIIQFRDAVYGDTFNPIEMLVSAPNYKVLGLVKGRMVSMRAQALPVFAVDGKQLMLGTFGQDLVRDLNVAKLWFDKPQAQQAHQIILSASLTDKK